MDKSKEVVNWADKAMYQAEEMPSNTPTVTLLSMNADPLGDIAAMTMMYEGKVVRNLDNVTDEQRKHYFEQGQKTHLKAPFESVQFHFLIEGVTRAFTHQMVRQRTACYAQESLRFAVKDKMAEEIPLPPSLAYLDSDHPYVIRWKNAIDRLQFDYDSLIDAGIPAEDARGLLPHAITTRLHYITNLRGLLEHGGNRLCTQAQYELRIVFTRIVEAIRNYSGPTKLASQPWREKGYNPEWQLELLSSIFRPICYLTGKCEFKANFDRACSIRERVDQNEKIGRPSSQWDQLNVGPLISPIKPEEWLLNPSAARER